MKTGAKGRRREYQAIEILNSEGYNCTRAAASKGLWDIIAILSRAQENRNPIVRVVQVKSNHPPPRLELERMRSYVTHGGLISKEIWIFKDGNTEPEIIKL